MRDRRGGRGRFEELGKNIGRDKAFSDDRFNGATGMREELSDPQED